MSKRIKFNLTRMIAAGLAAGSLLAGGGVARAQSGNSCAQPLFQPAKVYAPGGEPINFAVGDYDLDGNLDLVAALVDVSSAAVFLGAESGDLNLFFITDRLGLNPSDIATIDLNTNGDPDLIAANFTQQTFTIAEGLGDGKFYNPGSLAAGFNFQPARIEVADFDRDGTPDVVVIGGSTDRIAVVLGGGGLVMAPVTYFAARGGVSDVTVADFNNDSNPDIAVSQSNNNDVSVLLGDGKGGFSPAADYGLRRSASRIAAGDFDRDGYADLAVVNSRLNTLTVLLNDGDGKFPRATSFATGVSPAAMAAADFNNDGNPDIATTNTAGAVLGVQLGDGRGNFAPPKFIRVGGAGSVPIIVADFNRDTRPDVVVGNTYDQTVSLLLNACNSAKLDTDLDGTPDETDADDDGDGAIDAADNCQLTSNPDQADFDRDGIGDRCDAETGPPVEVGQCRQGGYRRFDTPRRFWTERECTSFVTNQVGR